MSESTPLPRPLPHPAELIGKTVVVEKKGNVFFYEVVRATPTSVVLLENQHQVVGFGHLSVQVTPKKGVYLRTREYRRGILMHDEHPWCLKVPEGIAVPWDGKSKNSKT